MSSSDIAISVKGLSKSYTIAHQGARATTLAEALIQRLRKPMGNSQRETFWALNDISLEIKKGDVVGVIGRNGAGKSTFLKILSRITEPTDGRIDLYGRVGSLLEVGTGFHPELTGRENVYLNGQILGMRRKEIARQFDAIVDFAGVERFLDTPVKRYSSGMYVRLAFAVAAHLDTEILLVDEVLAVGDAEFQKKCLGKMRDVASAGRTVLFVSHNMNAVSSLCQTGIFMQKGRVLLQASAREVLDLYSSAAQPAESFDLTAHENRGPGHAAVLQTLTFFDETGRMSRVFKPLAAMRIEIEIQTPEPIRIPKLSIGVTSSRGERVCAVASYLSQDPLPSLHGTQRISCSLQLPALVPGRYTLDVGISDGDLAFLDAVYTAAAFDVAEDNYLGTTHPNFAEMGQVMVRSNWQVEPGEGRLSDRSPDYLAAPASADR
jgi:lipopolysaccharide transport system ATP-binding protein